MIETRIVHVSAVLSLDKIGTITLYQALANRGHEVHLIGWGKSAERRTFVLPPYGRLIYHLLPGVRFPLESLTGPNPVLLSLYRTIKLINPDVVHINSYLKTSSVQTLAIAKLLRKPTVLTVHGTISSKSVLLVAIQRIYIATVGRIISRLVNNVICLTRSDALELQDLGWNGNRIVTIPNGVDVDLFRPSEESSQKTVLWIGRLSQEKGLRSLIMALYYVLRRDPEVTLQLGGAGPERSNLESLIRKLGIGGSVKFLGKVAFKDVPKVISGATVFVLCSLREGMPLALLEAMACGKPIIGTNVAGIRDLIIDSTDGLLVPPDNHVQLGKAILRMLSDRELRLRLSLNARHAALDHSWNIIAAKIEEVYENVADN